MLCDGAHLWHWIGRFLKTFLMSFCIDFNNKNVSWKLRWNICLWVSQYSRSVVSDCDAMGHSTPGLPVHHLLPELAQTLVHWVGDAIQPSHPLSSPSPPAFNLSQHQGLFRWVSSLHQVAKVLGRDWKTTWVPTDFHCECRKNASRDQWFKDFRNLNKWSFESHNFFFLLRKIPWNVCF